MPEWFDVAKDDQGTISLKVPPSTEHYVADQMRRSDCQGVTVYTGLLILQTRLAALNPSAATTRLAMRGATLAKLREPRSNAWGVWTVAASAGGPTHATTRSCCPTRKSKHRPQDGVASVPLFARAALCPSWVQPPADFS